MLEMWLGNLAHYMPLYESCAMSNKANMRKLAAQPGPRVLNTAPSVHAPKAFTDAKVEQSMDKHNAYFQTIAHPADVFGVKIPDGCYDESATVTEFARFQFDGGTNGYRAVMIGETLTDGSSTITYRGSLLPGEEDMTGTGALPWHLLFSGVATATALDIFWGGAGGGSTWMTHPGQATFTSTFRMVRLVSCGIRVTCAAAPLTAKGWLTVAALPRGMSRQGFFTSAATTLSSVLTLPGAKTVPLNDLGGGLSAIYRPLDNACLEYAVMSNDLAAGERDDLNWMRHDIGGFIVVAHGTDQLALPPFLIEFVGNYELTPKTNAVLVTTSPSYSDPLALSHALNRAEDIEPVKHSANGFDGTGKEDHPMQAVSLANVELPGVAPKKGATATAVDASAMGGVSQMKFSASSKMKSANRSIARQVDDGQPEDTFTRIMSVVLPLAEKFLPLLAGALL